ncbi:hypothetical protein DER44DRAFT_778224 [Fusarium oxysporum]|nr:hypothetical protein DER44DRAFT_778224 [Fusarium oxysporum]
MKCCSCCLEHTAMRKRHSSRVKMTAIIRPCYHGTPSMILAATLCDIRHPSQQVGCHAHRRRDKTVLSDMRSPLLSWPRRK